jgi:hypothetical protein
MRWPGWPRSAGAPGAPAGAPTCSRSRRRPRCRRAWPTTPARRAGWPTASWPTPGPTSNGGWPSIRACRSRAIFRPGSWRSCRAATFGCPREGRRAEASRPPRTRRMCRPRPSRRTRPPRDSPAGRSRPRAGSRPASVSPRVPCRRPATGVTAGLLTAGPVVPARLRLPRASARGRAVRRRAGCRLPARSARVACRSGRRVRSCPAGFRRGCPPPGFPVTRPGRGTAASPASRPGPVATRALRWRVLRARFPVAGRVVMPGRVAWALRAPRAAQVCPPPISRRPCRPPPARVRPVRHGPRRRSTTRVAACRPGRRWRRPHPCRATSPGPARALPGGRVPASALRRARGPARAARRRPARTCTPVPRAPIPPTTATGRIGATRPTATRTRTTATRTATTTAIATAATSPPAACPGGR